MIKAGDTLLFDVELLDFHEKAKERWEMSAAELMEEALKIKVHRYVFTSYGMCGGPSWVLREMG